MSRGDSLYAAMHSVDTLPHSMVRASTTAVSLPQTERFLLAMTDILAALYSKQLSSFTDITFTLGSQTPCSAMLKSERHWFGVIRHWI